MNKEYTILLESFEGPLDLLYQLVERRKLHINTISLAKVTDGFLEHIRSLSEYPIEEMARFVHIASLLVLIKSKSLLPILHYTKEEESDIAELEARLRLYEIIQKQAMPSLDIWKKVMASVTPSMPKEVQSFSPDTSCTLAGLHENATGVIQDLSFLKEPPKKRVQQVISLEEMINTVLKNVTERINLSFKDLTASAEKMNVIVSFLAVLELVRKDLLSVVQKEKFSDILITKKEEEL